MASDMVLGRLGGGSTSAPASGRGGHESAERHPPRACDLGTGDL